VNPHVQERLESLQAENSAYMRDLNELRIRLEDLERQAHYQAQELHVKQNYIQSKEQIIRDLRNEISSLNRRTYVPVQPSPQTPSNAQPQGKRPAVSPVGQNKRHLSMLTRSNARLKDEVQDLRNEHLAQQRLVDKLPGKFEKLTSLNKNTRYDNMQFVR
jgi:regulator of replication initiation timing